APWARQYADAHGGEPPAANDGELRNRKLEHIAVRPFVRDLERAFVNSGAVSDGASADHRAAVRAVRQGQPEQARQDPRAKLGQELGARYMLQGEIQAIEEEEGRERVVYYQFDATLIDLETNVKTWVGQHRIKKVIERPRFRL